MFCEGFKPDLITSTAYWDALEKYLRETDRTLHILVNSDSYIKDRPLQAVFEEQKRRGYDGTIQVRLIDDNGREAIKGQFNGALNNFSVFDDNMYRLEYEPSEYKAFGSFNNPEDAKLLLDLFNSVFEKSQPLNNGATA